MFDMDDVSLHKDATLAYFHSSVWANCVIRSVSSSPLHEAGIFYPFELQLCRMVVLCIPKNHMFFVLDFNVFWLKNDVTRLKAKFKFKVTAKQINNFERA